MLTTTPQGPEPIKRRRTAPKNVSKATQDDREVVASVLLELSGEGGTLTPGQVIEAARAPGHPLHRYFTWDDRVAAAAYRLDEARALLAWAKIPVRVERISLDVSAFVHDRTLPRGEQGYVSVLKLASNPDEARLAVVAEFKVAAGHLRRARDLAVALGCGHEIESLLRDVMAVSRRLGSEAA